MQAMEKIHDRLKRSREARGYPSAAQAAEAVGVPAPTYVHHENGTRGITAERAKQYARFFRVPEAWLLIGASSGIPDPFAKLPPDKVFSERQLITNPEDPELLDPDRGLDIGSETGRNGVPSDGIAQLDAIGGMGGGGLTIINEGVPGRHGMTFAAEAISDYWRLPSSIMAALGIRSSDAIMLQVKGDSNAPVLLEGDVVLVDTRHRWPSPDGFYALLDDFGEVIVKRLHSIDSDEDDRWIEILSANPAYTSRRRRVEELQIIGRVSRRFSAVF